MPQLRILILDGAETDSMLSGFHLPNLAMLSWRDAVGPSLQFALETVKSAAVLDISGNNKLLNLPDDLQVCSPFLRKMLVLGKHAKNAVLIDAGKLTIALSE